MCSEDQAQSFSHIQSRVDISSNTKVKAHRECIDFYKQRGHVSGKTYTWNSFTEEGIQIFMDKLIAAQRQRVAA